MTKIIKIENCKECSECTPIIKEDKLKGFYCNIIEGLTEPNLIEDDFKIPDWCPLEDLKV